MKIKSVILVSILSLIGIAAINTAYADTAASVTATCKDGTSFTGTSKKGACSGHKGVKTWGAAPVAAAATATTAAVAAAPAAKAAAPMAAPAKAKTAEAPKVAAAGGGAGKVWVNDKSNVYHCLGSKDYGTTKSGAYMTEAEAKAKGARASRGKACS
jgi:hypothetical protein